MYIYSQVDFFFFFVTLDCESMTTGHLPLSFTYGLCVCVYPGTQTRVGVPGCPLWRHRALSCSPGTGTAPTGTGTSLGGWHSPGHTTGELTDCYPEQAK